MKNFQISLLLLVWLCSVTLMAQSLATPIAVQPNEQVVYVADLRDGNFIPDLSWAWSSSNACFPATQQAKFTGKHVLFTGIIPAYTELTITITPDDPKANFSLYAYQVGEDNLALVPDLPRCIRCEADHKQERRFVGKAAQDHRRSVSNLLALNRPYRFVVGVTGADGLASGGFRLAVEAKSR